MRESGTWRLARWRTRGGTLLLLAAGAVVLAACALGPGSHEQAPAKQAPAEYGAGQEVRALWVTRYDYRTAEDVRELVRNAGALGVNRVLFQVRGQADAFYRSRLEPWAEELGGVDPGFDPLEVACDEAAAQNPTLAVEAWINAMPLWKGTTPPANPAHAFHMHPEWLVVGSDGRPQAMNRHYICMNPAREDVREHLAAVTADIAGRYPVAAIHLDYIRYVTDLENVLDFSFDEPTLAAFGKDPAAFPEEWRRFKTDQVSEVVRAVRRAVIAARPNSSPVCGLTAAVFPTAASRARVSQDAARWLSEGWVDAVYPMLYSVDEAEFAARLQECVETLPGPIVAGLGVHRHPDAATTLRQVQRARENRVRGFALFCYASFYPSRDQAEVPERNRALQAERVAAVKGLDR